MVKLTKPELRALFVQYQQHLNCESVHIHRGLFGKIHFRFEEPHTKEALREVQIAEKKLEEAKRKAKAHH